MRKILSLAWVAVLLICVGCADEILVSHLPEIALSVENQESYESVEVQLPEEGGAVVLDLGDVPVYVQVKARVVVESLNTQELRVTRVDYREGDTIGGRWDAPTWVKSASDTVSKVPPFSVPVGGSRIIEIPLTPMAEGATSAVVEVESNAKNGKIKTITLRANGIYHGAPEIELVYNGMVVPEVGTDCVGGVCAIPAEKALDLGNIGLNTSGTAQILIKNLAECEAYPGADPCSSCPLIVDRNSRHHGIGVGFKEGTNTDARFSFVGSTAVPFVVAQKNVDCSSEGKVKLLVSFDAPDTEGSHEAVIVIESNDPDESVIEIPIRAVARNAPVAIAKVRGYDMLNPSSPYTDPEDIEPLDRIYLDGRESHDPSVLPPDDPTALPYYHWEVIERPAGTEDVDFDWTGQDTALPSMWIPIAGHYSIRLTVRNSAGIESGDTAQARVELDAVPGSAMHVQLVWDHPTNDQDLHMVNVAQSPNLCNSEWDCYFATCNHNDFDRVHWFPGHPIGQGPNPRLDRDDTNGLGPENINIDEPTPGTYRIFVHYWPSWGNSGTATVNTVRIYLNGVLRFDQHRTLSSGGQVWALADILWMDDNTPLGNGTVSVYPSPEAGQVGAVASGLTAAQCGVATGWTFPN